MIIEDSQVPVLYESEGKIRFNHGGIFVTNPYISTCGRFDVDPVKFYGLGENQLCNFVMQLR